MSSTTDRGKLLDQIGKAAYDYELAHHGCSRSVVNTLTRFLELGTDKKLVRASIPLAGGIARTANTCGALLGSLMVIGVALANDDEEDSENLYGTLVTASRFYRNFENAEACLWSYSSQSRAGSQASS